MDSKSRLHITVAGVALGLPCLVCAVAYTLAIQPDHLERRIWPSMAILYVMATLLRQERLSQNAISSKESDQARPRWARMVTYTAGTLILVQLVCSYIA